jgi:catechol 2,3-dioxygenase
MYTGGILPLDLPSLLSMVTATANDHAAPGLRTGHLHLHVGDIDLGIEFWVGVLGFDLMAQMGDSAAFVSAGGYHHHLGFNTWKGTGVPPLPDGVVGLRNFTATVPTQGDLDALAARLAAAGAWHEVGEDGTLVLRDPWSHELHVAVATSAA